MSQPAILLTCVSSLVSRNRRRNPWVLAGRHDLAETKLARFYFHIENGEGRCPDEEGVELPSAADARAHAVAGIRSILAEEVTQGTVDLAGRIEVVNEAGTQLFAVRYSEAVQILGEP